MLINSCFCILVMSVGANELFIATAKIYSGFSILLMSCSSLIAPIVLCYIVCIEKQKGANPSSHSELSVMSDENRHQKDEIY